MLLNLPLSRALASKGKGKEEIQKKFKYRVE